MLNFRLQMIFDLARGPELWDIGCDHGLLALHNLETKKFSRVVSVDRSNLVMDRLAGRLPEGDLMCIAGEHLDWSLVSGSVVMCGFGAENMMKVLNSCGQQHAARLQWILSPQNSVEWFDRQAEKALLATHKLQLLWVDDGRVRRPLFLAESEPSL